MKNKVIGIITLIFAITSLVVPVSAKKGPKISVTPEAFFFSPNQDGIMDNAVFQIEAKKRKKISNWKIQFQDTSGVIQRTISGEKDMPSNVSWDGQDDFGTSLQEGSYDATFFAWDKKNRSTTTSPMRIVLDLTPPTISLTASQKVLRVIESNIPPIELQFSAVDLSGILEWEIDFKDENNDQFYIETSTWPLPSSWTLSSAQAMIPAGKIKVVLSVIDKAGNLTQSSPVKIDIQKEDAAEEPMVEEEPQVTQAHPKRQEVNMLRVTSIMSLSDLFGMNADNESSLTPQSSVLLDGVAKSLINSPGAKATILGHVDRQSSSRRAMALSSYFAWKIYSYLVKTGGVDKGAVSVKGLGSDLPIADNRSASGRNRNRRIEIQMFMPAEY